MKMKFLVLPLVMLIALPSCNNANRPDVKNGSAPKGGQKITDEAQLNQELGTLANKCAFALKDNDNFEVFALADGFDASFSSTRFNSNFTLSDFGIEGGFTHLFDGDSKKVKGALGFTGATLSYKVDAVPEDTNTPETHWDKKVKFGELATYFNDGNMYIDASEAKPFETIQGLARAAEPFYDIMAKRNDALKVVSPLVSLFTQTDTTKVEEAFDDFGGKLEVKEMGLGAVTTFATALQAATNDDVAIAAENVKNLLKKQYGIVWDDVASMYTYKTGEKAIEFKLDNDDLLGLIQPEDVEYYDISFNNSFLDFAIYFDEEGFPVALSYESKVNAVANAALFTTILGSPLTFKFKSGFDIFLDHNNVGEPVMPSDLDEYKGITSLILKLTSLLIK